MEQVDYLIQEDQWQLDAAKYWSINSKRSMNKQANNDDGRETITCLRCFREVVIESTPNEGRPMADDDELKRFEGMCQTCVWEVREQEEN